MKDRMDLAGVKRKLQGRAFTRLMRDLGTNKWRLAKVSGISYRTLAYWETSVYAPSDELAARAARALGINVE